MWPSLSNTNNFTLPTLPLCRRRREAEADLTDEEREDRRADKGLERGLNMASDRVRRVCLCVCIARQVCVSVLLAKYVGHMSYLIWNFIACAPPPPFSYVCMVPLPPFHTHQRIFCMVALLQMRADRRAHRARQQVSHDAVTKRLESEARKAEFARQRAAKLAAHQAEKSAKQARLAAAQRQRVAAKAAERQQRDADRAEALQQARQQRDADRAEAQRQREAEAVARRERQDAQRAQRQAEDAVAAAAAIALRAQRALQRDIDSGYKNALRPFDYNLLTGTIERREGHTNINRHYIGKFGDVLCEHCGAMLWEGEKSSLCCNNGKTRIPNLPDLPPALDALFHGM